VYSDTTKTDPLVNEYEAEIELDCMVKVRIVDADLECFSVSVHNQNSLPVSRACKAFHVCIFRLVLEICWQAWKDKVVIPKRNFGEEPQTPGVPYEPMLGELNERLPNVGCILHTPYSTLAYVVGALYRALRRPSRTLMPPEKNG
jgi:hypothetical protein